MTKNLKKDILDIIANNPPKSEFAKITAKALKAERFDKVAIFDFGEEGNTKLVMINTNASEKELESGCVFDSDKIVRFKNSDDGKSVSVDILTRFLVFDSITDEATRLRLKSISRGDVTWVIHSVHDDDERKFPKCFCNIHSHGMRAFTHKDFQIVLDLGDEIGTYIINSLCKRVRDGESFMPGQKIYGVYNSSFPVKLSSAKECDKPALRVLIPDSSGRFPGDEGCSAPYCDQLGFETK